MPNAFDSLEFGNVPSPLRRYARRSLLVGATAAALVASGYRLQHQSAPRSPEENPNVDSTSAVYFPLGSFGKELKFTKHGSYLLTVSYSGDIEMIDGQKDADVSFDNLHCKDEVLRGGMTITTFEPTSSILSFDDLLPENQLSDSCQNGQTLSAAHVGKLVIAGITYPYTLSN
jgi:hypothetical protein